VRSETIALVAAVDVANAVRRVAEYEISCRAQGWDDLAAIVGDRSSPSRPSSRARGRRERRPRGRCASCNRYDAQAGELPELAPRWASTVSDVKPRRGYLALPSLGCYVHRELLQEEFDAFIVGLVVDGPEAAQVAVPNVRLRRGEDPRSGESFLLLEPADLESRLIGAEDPSVRQKRRRRLEGLLRKSSLADT